MTDLYSCLCQRLLNVKRLAFLCIGNLMMGDDGAGIILGKMIKERTNKNISVAVFAGHSAPENFTGAIKDFKADHVIVIDAADLKENPGSVMIIQRDVITGVSFSTHSLPIKIIVQYLESETGCTTTIIGIQPQHIEYGKGMTPVMKKAVKETAKVINKTIAHLTKA